MQTELHFEFRSESHWILPLKFHRFRSTSMNWIGLRSDEIAGTRFLPYRNPSLSRHKRLDCSVKKNGSSFSLPAVQFGAGIIFGVLICYTFCSYCTHRSHSSNFAAVSGCRGRRLFFLFFGRPSFRYKTGRKEAWTVFLVTEFLLLTYMISKSSHGVIIYLLVTERTWVCYDDGDVIAL